MSVPPQQPPGPGQPGGPSPYGPPAGGPSPYGPPPGGGQPYGSPYPGQQPPPGFTPRAAPGPVEKPKEVETAFRLGVLAALISIVGAALSFVTSGPAVEATIARGQVPPGITPEQFRQFAVVGVAVGAAFVLVIVALLLLFLFKMRAGRNWARILLAILGLLSIALGVWGLTTSGQMLALGAVGVVSVVLSVLQMVAIAGSIFFMFRPAAAPYFQQDRP